MTVLAIIVLTVAGVIFVATLRVALNAQRALSRASELFTEADRRRRNAHDVYRAATAMYEQVQDVASRAQEFVP